MSETKPTDDSTTSASDLSIKSRVAMFGSHNTVLRYFKGLQTLRRRRLIIDLIFKNQTAHDYATLQTSVESPTSGEAGSLPVVEAMPDSPLLESERMPSDNPFRYDAARLEAAHDVVAAQNPDSSHVRSLRRLQAMSPEQMAALARDGETDAIETIETIEESGRRWMDMRKSSQ